MQTQDSSTEVTFHYIDGKAESFDIPVTPEAFATQLQDLLKQPMLTLHLFDKTVFICTTQIIKVEVKPPVTEVQGQGIFDNVQLVTALSHGSPV
ncbi:MAG: hypothetical protein F6K21_08845 [Symploca sp. SIO2D2]|nr:hypothetical protein [Symploca sp. SIO2D2]NER23212.1 hypothetical protein [Symploca sp. SIO1C2]